MFFHVDMRGHGKARSCPIKVGLDTIVKRRDHSSSAGDSLYNVGITTLWGLVMRIVVCNLLLVLLILGSAGAEQKSSPKLQVFCAVQPSSSAASDSVDLSVSLENVGPSDIYLYRTLAWGWAGVRFRLTNRDGKVIAPRNWTVPPPPPPVYKKENLVGIAPTYFYGTHMQISLSEYYDLRPGIYYLQILYRSNYRTEDGFGLPILTSQDGEFLSNRVRIEIPPA
jgi:hypothetical protein